VVAVLFLPLEDSAFLCSHLLRFTCSWLWGFYFSFVELSSVDDFTICISVSIRLHLILKSFDVLFDVSFQHVIEIAYSFSCQFCCCFWSSSCIYVLMCYSYSSYFWWYLYYARCLLITAHICRWICFCTFYAGV